MAVDYTKLQQATQKYTGKKRGGGVRMQLKAIPGTTKGNAAKVLKTPYRFQCPPLDELSFPKTRATGRYTNYKGTEFATRGGMQLQTFTVRTLAVEWGTFVVEYNWNVDKLCRDLDLIIESGWPVEMLITHWYTDKTPEFHGDVLLESYTRTERADEPDARYLDLSFTQWRPPTANRRSRRPSTKTWPKTATIDKKGTIHFKDGKKHHTLKNGSLSDLAKAAYGKGTLGWLIADAQKPPIRHFGQHTPLKQLARYKGKGGKILVPQPLVATTGLRPPK